MQYPRTGLLSSARGQNSGTEWLVPHRDGSISAKLARNGAVLRWLHSGEGPETWPHPRAEDSTGEQTVDGADRRNLKITFSLGFSGSLQGFVVYI